VIFDLEAVFIVAWAVAFRELGWRGYIEVVVFIGIVLAALVYLWRQHALDRGAVGRTMPTCRDTGWGVDDAMVGQQPGAFSCGACRR
jgi:hypothetical protein